MQRLCQHLVSLVRQIGPPETFTSLCLALSTFLDIAGPPVKPQSKLYAFAYDACLVSRLLLATLGSETTVLDPPLSLHLKPIPIDFRGADDYAAAMLPAYLAEYRQVIQREFEPTKAWNILNIGEIVSQTTRAKALTGSLESKADVRRFVVRASLPYGARQDLNLSEGTLMQIACLPADVDMETDATAWQSPDKLLCILVGRIEEVSNTHVCISVLVQDAFWWSVIATGIQHTVSTGTNVGPPLSEEDKGERRPTVEDLLGFAHTCAETDASAAAQAAVHLPSWASFQWVYRPLFSPHTSLQEFTALMSVTQSPLCACVLRPTFRRFQKAQQLHPLALTDELWGSMQAVYNASQLAALQETRFAEGITLVQGPPGTGKTSTIIAIASIILNSTETQVGSTTSSTPDRPNLNRSPADTQTLLRLAQPWLYGAALPAETETTLDMLDEYVGEAVDPASIIRLETHRSSGSRKILICAPSNTAVDEIVERLVRDPASGGGLLDRAGRRYAPKVLRVGPNADAKLREWTVDAKVEALLAAQGYVEGSLGAVKHALAEEVILSTPVVCCTLAIAASSRMTAADVSFDAVIVDEASQCVEPSNLLPLLLGCRKAVFVGDPLQLPATVFSATAIRLKYDRSLFQRMASRGKWPVYTLREQYRMHPAISQFPCREFYTTPQGEKLLVDAPNVLQRCQQPPYQSAWHEVPVFRAFTFFSIMRGTHETSNKSLVNKDECEVVMQLIDLYRALREAGDAVSAQSDWKKRIAVISPYAEQVALLRQQCRALVDGDEIEVNTVDSFQGREKDVIIFSAVRSIYQAGTHDRTHIGFLSDARRLNVALTRARDKLWVVGNAQFLQGHPMWHRFCALAAETSSMFAVHLSADTDSAGYFYKYVMSYLGRQPQLRARLAAECPQFVARVEKMAATL